jgi:hypothetical protein
MSRLDFLDVRSNTFHDGQCSKIFDAVPSLTIFKCGAQHGDKMVYLRGDGNGNVISVSESNPRPVYYRDSRYKSAAKSIRSLNELCNDKDLMASYHLSLNGFGLTSIPSCLSKFSTSYLSLEDNRIKTIDVNAIGKNVKSIHLDGNRIKELPKKLRDLEAPIPGTPYSRLGHVSLNYNDIDDIENVVKTVDGTKISVELAGNNIKSVSNEQASKLPSGSFIGSVKFPQCKSAKLPELKKICNLQGYTTSGKTKDVLEKTCCA